MPALFAILIVLACWDCVKSAIRYSADDYRAFRAGAGRAGRKTASGTALPAPSPRPGRGWWTREVLRGFPAARTGWNAGWLAHRTAVDQRRALREEARTTHLESRASFLSGLREHRERQAEALALIDEEVRRAQAEGRKTARQAVDEVARKRAEKAQQDPPLPADTVKPEPGAQHPARQADSDTDATAEQEPGPDAATPRGDKPVPQPSTEGSTMAADTTYDQLMKESQDAINEQEQHIESLRRSQVGNWVDGLTGLLNDSHSLSRAAEVDEALRAEQKAAQQVMDALQAFRDGLRHDHGGMNEAHQDAPVRGAQPEFYEG
jgi:hypothetical protein